MGVPFKIKAAQFKTFGTVCADPSGFNHGKAPYKIIIINLCVAVSGGIRIRYFIIPAFRIRFSGCLKCGHAALRCPLFSRFIQFIVIKRDRVHEVWAVHPRFINSTCSVRSRVVDGRCLEAALCCGTGYLHECFNKIGLPVGICIMICLDINTEP